MGFRGFPEGNPSPRYLWPRVRVLRAWEVRVAICRACAPPSLDVARAASSQKLGLLRAADPGEPAPEVRPPLNERAVLGGAECAFLWVSRFPDSSRSQVGYSRCFTEGESEAERGRVASSGCTAPEGPNTVEVPSVRAAQEFWVASHCVSKELRLPLQIS